MCGNALSDFAIRGATKRCRVAHFALGCTRSIAVSIISHSKVGESVVGYLISDSKVGRNVGGSLISDTEVEQSAVESLIHGMQTDRHTGMHFLECMTT